MREAEKQCALVQREREVLRALETLNSSYSEIETVDARCMPYVSTPASYQYHPQQSAEDAAKWLIGWKNRQETRHKLLMAEIEARSSRCKGCRARYDYRLVYTCIIVMVIAVSDLQVWVIFRRTRAKSSPPTITKNEQGQFRVRTKHALSIRVFNTMVAKSDQQPLNG